jgi:ubiquitin-protein ligase E3 A
LIGTATLTSFLRRQSTDYSITRRITELGNVGTEIVPRPRILPGLPPASAVAAGLSSSLIVHRDGSTILILPDPPSSASSPALPHIAAVAAGHDYALYVSTAGTLLVTGTTAFGALAHGPNTPTLPAPTVVPALAHAKIVAVAAGSAHWLALDSLSRVYSCGHNASGQCGNGATENLHTPQIVVGLWSAPVIHVSAGDTHSAVLTVNGDIFCFGANKYGQTGQTGFSIKLATLYPTRVLVPDALAPAAVTAPPEPATAFDVDGDAVMSPASSNAPRRKRDPSPSPSRSHAAKLYYVDVACGGMHTVALRSDGVLVCWGKGMNGQVGQGSSANAYAPIIARPSAGYNAAGQASAPSFLAVSAGARHSAAVATNGTAYLWGDGHLGQIADGDMSDKLRPVMVRAPRLPTPSTPGSSPGPGFVRIACGGYHNIALVSDVEHPFSVREMYWARIPSLNVDQIITAKSGFRCFGSAALMFSNFVDPGATTASVRVQAARALKAYSSFIAVFGPEGESVLGQSAARIRHEAQAAFGMLKPEHELAVLIATASPSAATATTTVVSTTSSGDAVATATAQSRLLLTSSDRLAQSKDNFRMVIADLRETGVTLFIAFLNPIYEGRTKDRLRELAELVTLVVRIRHDAEEAFVSCCRHCLPELVAKCIVRPLQFLISDELRSRYRVTTRATNATKVIALCHRANEDRRKYASPLTRLQQAVQSGQDIKDIDIGSGEDGDDGSLIPAEEFYNDMVSEMIDLQQDWVRWKQAQEEMLHNRQHGTSGNGVEDDDIVVGRAPEPVFSFCDYSFLLSKVAKFKILGIEAHAVMDNEAFRSLMTFGTQSMPRNFMHIDELGFLVIKVRRSSIVSDMFSQLSEIVSAAPRDLHKTLRVQFVGEEGLDEGGVRKEFFQVLTEQLFSEDYGMFEYHAETRNHWFRRDSLEDPVAFMLVGVAIGLALYNSILLDIQFPPVIYRKLHGALLFVDQNRDADSSEHGRSLYEPVLEDVMEVFPAIGNSLKNLLEYPGDDVEDVFCLNYEVSYEGLFKTTETVQLVPSGADKPVTSKNKAGFVRCYTDYLIDDSIDSQFSHFAKGLMFLNSSFLNKFSPEELESLVVGEKELDFEALRATCKYEGYTAESSTVVNLWTVLFELDTETREKFLSFVTGSDRAPIGGLGNLGLVIQRSESDSDRLPTSHTCFNVLLLPDYGSRAKLRTLLLLAIQNSTGFGLQ